jgi:2-dehydro-3-deoxygluconokinase
MNRDIDVVVIGEALIELSSTSDLVASDELQLGVSGDAFNAAVASAATGAHTALVTRVGCGVLGQRILSALKSHGVITDFVRTTDLNDGLYLQSIDAGGDRNYVYYRKHSAGSTLSPSDVPVDLLGAASYTLVSGITQAISATARQAVLHAVKAACGGGAHVVFDPNYRPLLTTQQAARAAAVEILPYVSTIVPSCPTDTMALLNETEPTRVAERYITAGLEEVVVTLGSEGVLFADTNTSENRAAIPAEVIDPTGAGDAFVGTFIGERALGRGPSDAIDAALRAASIAVTKVGGALPTGLDQTIDSTDDVD